MSVHSSAAAVFQIPDRGLAAGCSGPWCELTAIATEPGVVTAVALVGVLAMVAFAYIRDAETACRRERRRILDERDAFESFADRVAEVDTMSAATDSTPSGVPAGGFRGVGVGRRPGGEKPGPDATLRRVLAAYGDTVLSLPHYRAEYEETAAESLAAELGPDTVTALASDGGLSAGTQSALVDRSRQAVSAREALAGAIDEEIDELGRRESAMATIDRRRQRLLDHLEGVRGDRETDAAIDVWNRLADLEGRCDELAADRQRSLDDPPLRPEAAPDADCERPFYQYLYGPADGPRHPVLAAVAEVADRVRADMDEVGARIAGGG